jgi:hypothetical protein
MKASSIDIGLLRDAPRAGEKLSAERDLRPSRNTEWDWGFLCFYAFAVFLFYLFSFGKSFFFVSFVPPHRRQRNEVKAFAMLRR